MNLPKWVNHTRHEKVVNRQLDPTTVIDHELSIGKLEFDVQSYWDTITARLYWNDKPAFMFISECLNPWLYKHVVKPLFDWLEYKHQCENTAVHDDPWEVHDPFNNVDEDSDVSKHVDDRYYGGQ